MINLDSERVEEQFELETWKKRWALLAVIPITLLAFGLRYLPAGEMERLQALDPYFLERMSQQIAYSGGLPPVDFLSYFPYSLPTYIVDQGMVWIPALLHNAGLGIFFDSYVEYAQFVTPMFGALTVFVMYFIGKELFNKITGVSAAFFLATIPGVMRRSSAGFFEKEAIGGFFMVMTLYFFIRAWKYKEWPSGIVSGLALGLFSISWGGSQMTWLLYPLIVFATIFVDKDIRSLVVAYTPTVIIGGIIPAAIQPVSFGLTDPLILGNIALLVFLWSRYLIGELSLMKEEYQPYYVPVMSIVGFVMVHFSALYSKTIASIYLSIRGKISAASTTVIGQTVAENAALTVQELSSQLNTLYAGAINPVLGALSNIFGTWPLAFIGIGLLSTTIVLMLASRYELIEDKISSEYYLGAFLSTFTVWVIAFALFFQNPVSAIAPSLLVVIGGSIFYYFIIDPEKKIEITQRWYLMIPFFWALSNILGAASRSRLIFLASFPVAFMAGYTVSRLINFIRDYDLSNVTERVEGRELTIGLISGLSVIMIMIGAGAGYASVQGISESPNSAWMDSLNYLENQTEPDSVVLSWWDYGYHIETIGERSAVADGGNRNFMTDQGGKQLPHNIADLFTSNGSDTTLLEKHSVDYLMLDQPMIAKYGAVSQIANSDNPDQATSLLSFRTSNLRSDTAVNPENQQEGTSTLRNSQTGYTLNVPVNITRQGQARIVEIADAPQLAQGSKPRVGCMIRSDGTIKDFEGVSSEVGGLGNYCVAEDPYYTLTRGMTYQGSASVVLVPRDLADNVFVQLMFGDGQQIEWADKVEDGSNGFIKMWEIDREE